MNPLIPPPPLGFLFVEIKASEPPYFTHLLRPRGWVTHSILHEVRCTSGSIWSDQCLHCAQAASDEGLGVCLPWFRVSFSFVSPPAELIWFFYDCFHGHVVFPGSVDCHLTHRLLHVVRFSPALMIDIESQPKDGSRQDHRPSLFQLRLRRVAVGVKLIAEPDRFRFPTRFQLFHSTFNCVKHLPL